MSRYCEQCGAKLEAGENFCPSCGEKVIVDEINPNQPSPKPAPTTPNKNSMMIFGVALTFALLIGAGWYFYNKYFIFRFGYYFFRFKYCRRQFFIFDFTGQY